MRRHPQRLIQLARSVNDNVVGEHIGQLCRDLADALEVALAASDAPRPVTPKEVWRWVEFGDTSRIADAINKRFGVGGGQ